jgi:hypothetical protein
MMQTKRYTEWQHLFLAMDPSFKLLPCKGEVAPSSGTEGFSFREELGLKEFAPARPETLHSYAKATARMPSRCAIHLPSF